MNKLDKQYTDLLDDILTNGVRKEDRTGTGTLSVFGRQIRHKMSKGFPLLTTKKMPFKTIATELIWFLRGDTNIKWLVDNDCNIWNGDAFKVYKAKAEKERDDLISSGALVSYVEPTMELFIEGIKYGNKFTGESAEEFAKKHGDLGPIYGKQWRAWERFDEYEDSFKVDVVEDTDEHIGFTMGSEGMVYERDQIVLLIQELKNNPDSRRMMVNAWNVGEIDKMVLPPCHYGFQVYTRNLSNKELETYLIDNKPELYDELSADLMDNMTISLREKVEEYNVSLDIIPTRAISLLWNQRSVDTFLGLPFNIASYGLLLEILAKEVNMIPDELIGNLGDTHLYLNHVDQAREQIGSELSDEQLNEVLKELASDTYASFIEFKVLKDNAVKEAKYEEASIFQKEERKFKAILADLELPLKSREPFKLPTLGEIPSYLCIKDDFECYEPNDFKLLNYKSHPTIKAPLSN
jgi:thymidylate synthase